jgi:putative transposase
MPSTNYRKNCKRYNDPGHAHALNFSCFRRQPFLSKERSCTWLVDAIDRARTRHEFHVWAYVIMPEHARLLIWPTTAIYDVSDVLSSIKQSVAKKALIHVRRTAPSFLIHMEDRQPNGDTHYRFWQRGGGYDRNVIEPGTVHREIDYFHNNPVRRGRCVKPDDWVWSSAADYLGSRTGPLRIDRESVPSIVVP